MTLPFFLPKVCVQKACFGVDQCNSEHNYLNQNSVSPMSRAGGGNRVPLCGMGWLRNKNQEKQNNQKTTGHRKHFQKAGVGWASPPNRLSFQTKRQNGACVCFIHIREHQRPSMECYSPKKGLKVVCPVPNGHHLQNYCERSSQQSGDKCQVHWAIYCIGELQIVPKIKQNLPGFHTERRHSSNSRVASCNSGLQILQLQAYS